MPGLWLTGRASVGRKELSNLRLTVEIVSKQAMPVFVGVA